MHVPDHFLTPEASVVTGIVAASAVVATMAVRPTPVGGARLSRVVGSAALVFGLQMVNFPVLEGTSGHLMGGVLAAALVGPRLALLVMTGVLATQALLFGDGGVSALGTNVLLMGIVPVAVAAGAHASARALGAQRFVRSTVAAASLVSVPVAALMFAVLYALGGTGAVNAAGLALSMAGIHLLIGLGEMLISVAVLSLVLWVAPGAAAWDDRAASSSAPATGAIVLGASAVVSAAFLAAFAAGSPDGLETVALAYRLPGGEAILTGVPFLSEYGALAGANVGLVGVIGVLAAVLLTGLITWPLRFARDGARRPAVL